MNWLRPAVRRPLHRRSRRAIAIHGPETLERRVVLAALAPHVDALQGVSDPEIVPTMISADPSFGDEWGLRNSGQYGGVPGTDINAASAWDVTTGSRDVVVAVIDSGIDLTHPDLAANLWVNPGEIAGNGLDDDHNGFVDDIHGWDFVDGDAVPQDGYGHGTHVAGIIGAVGDNGLGIAGVSWRVSLMVLRVENDSGAGSTSAVLAALQYATMMRRDHGINVVVTNNSWESPAGFSLVVQDVIRAQGEAGITFVAAAGNHGTNNDALPRYPANYDLPNVISVASLTPAGILSGTSDYGATTVDIAAPGTLIQSTWIHGGYGMLSGTSMAAPHVSGVVALVAAAKPGITVNQIRSAILGSARPVAALAGMVATGGRLDARRALDAALGTTAAAPTPTPTPTPVVPPAPAPTPVVTVIPPTVVQVSLPFTDAFNQPSGSLPAAAWRQRAKGFTVSGGSAVATSPVVSLMTVRTAKVTNVSLRASVNVSTGRSVGLVARYAGPADSSMHLPSMYLAQLAMSGRKVVAQMWKQVEGQWTLHSSRTVAGGVGSLRFDVVGSRLSLFFKGRRVASVRDGTIAAAGAVGVQADGSGGRIGSFTALRA
jgi:subtilisin family serine protease